MLKVFIIKPLENVPFIAFLRKEAGANSSLFQAIPPEAYQGLFEEVDDPKQADVALLPHEYAKVKDTEYLVRLLSDMKAVGKKVIVSSYGDSTEPILLENAIILRPSAYKSTLLPNEIMMPGYVEDVGAGRDTSMLPKSEKPKVGFVGLVDVPSVKEWGKYFLRNYVLRHGAARQGLYFRRAMLSALRHHPCIDLRVIRRHSYSGNVKTISLSPEQARAEYIDSILQSHFTLSPRGDGNFSTRFFEVLSLGRIPIVIDTDMVLPLEDLIPYEQFVLRVPYQEIPRLAKHIRRFWETHSQADLVAMGMQAKEAFHTHLYMPAFLRTVFSHDFLEPYLRG